MNIYQFTESKDYDKEYNYKILVYPNITYMKDLEKDSYVVVLRNVIKELNYLFNIPSQYIYFPNTSLLNYLTDENYKNLII